MGDSGNLTSIIIALLGLLSLTITIFGGAVIFFGKWFAKNYGKDMKAHTEAALNSSVASKQLTKAVDRNTESNDQVLTFMKNLNGKLAKATIQTVKEQKVEHQIIESRD